ncbi:Urotensin-2B [Platysternon megacephalum]|uniref:Urotensin-2B n=1 Tax=Platysternon megacephalum TaxID=55544 RepID=A0A4D9E3P9_9SAUR|nr:Urotensin-2B [Platysternon megacephalum]
MKGGTTLTKTCYKQEQPRSSSAGAESEDFNPPPPPEDPPPPQYVSLSPIPPNLPLCGWEIFPSSGLVPGNPFIPASQPERGVLCAAENQGFPERGDTNHQDVLLTLLLNKNLGWRQPADSNLELAKKFEELEQLEMLKEQLLAGEGSEEAYAEAGLLPSHPDKRACFWKYCV